MRLGDIGQRIGRPDIRSQLAKFDQHPRFIELAPILTCKHEVIIRVLTPSLGDVLWLCDIDDRDQPVELRQHMWRASRCRC